MISMIGITMSYNGENTYTLKETYAKAVRQAGGIPVAVPPIDDEFCLRVIAKKLDGIILTGGVDVDPMLFDENPHQKLGKICPLRDTVEIFLVKEMMRLKKPILGICRGMQVLNVALGGSIIQDIPTDLPNAIKHQQDAPGWYATHKIDIIDSYSWLSQIFKKSTVMVNSYHHQSLKDIAPDFKISAKAPDGVIEAIELKDRDVFCVGVQWHPEEMCDKSPDQQRIFEYFLDATKTKIF